MTYPFYEGLQDVSQNMTSGNFGLWYNKFIPISSFDACKASDESGDKDNAVSYYHGKYKQSKKDKINLLLEKRHCDQAGFCKALSSEYEAVILKAKLKTPLITGIGEAHPHEVSMVFDHNLGIPYIPASGIKGIVRFAHTLGLIDKIPDGKIVERDKDKKSCPPHFDDEEDWTHIPQLFGTQAKRGAVFFLDAYPEKTPDLHVDIMNPHYGEYYGEETKPPGDYLNPIPLKFLTVAKDTVFIFRALVDKKNPELTNMVKTAFRKALTEEGVGAKTAVGYGLFDLPKGEMAKTVREAAEKKDLVNSTSDNSTESFSTPPTPLPEPKKAPEPEIWEKVILSYAPNTQTISASKEGKTATTKNEKNKEKNIVPEPLLEKMMKKKKTVTVTLKAELIGGNAYRITEIKE